MVERIAHAKINLALHVTGQRDDGYHLLDSIVVFSQFGDQIAIKKPHHPHGPVEVALYGECAAGLPSGMENLATSAAMLLRDTAIRQGYEVGPVLIELTKNLPVASGIGGGSSDAAATLLGLQEFWNTEVDLLPIAQSLGSDVSMCLQAIPLRAQGTGNQISHLEGVTSFPMVLVNPGIEVSTPSVFNGLTNKNHTAISDDEIKRMPSIAELSELRNDLAPSAIELAPQIQTVLNILSDTQPLLARMSGSGATCFGLYNTIEEAEVASAAIRSERPEWWCVSTQTTAS